MFGLPPCVPVHNVSTELLPPPWLDPPCAAGTNLGPYSISLFLPLPSLALPPTPPRPQPLQGLGPSRWIFGATLKRCTIECSRRLSCSVSDQSNKHVMGKAHLIDLRTPRSEPAPPLMLQGFALLPWRDGLCQSWGWGGVYSGWAGGPFSNTYWWDADAFIGCARLSILWLCLQKTHVWHPYSLVRPRQKR